MRAGVGLVLLMACQLTVACKDKAQPTAEKPTEPWPARPAASAATRQRVTLSVSEGSKVSFELPGKGRRLKGEFNRVSGSFEADLGDLSGLGGRLIVDLSSLQLATPDLAAEPSLELTAAQAMQWLELGSEVAPQKRERLGQGRMTISGLRQATEQELLPPEPRADNKTLQRRADGEAEGDLELHATRVHLLVPLRITAFYDNDGAAVRFSHADVESRSPLTLDLPTFGIQPRTAQGTLDSTAQASFSKSLGRGARVSVFLRLRPANGDR
jgi:hypothetical protein